MTISRRKSDHIRIAVEHDVGFRLKTTGFERVELVHCALPEINFDEVSSETRFLGKILSFPLMISPITGGYDGAYRINRMLAETCREEKIALCVGSQRQILENDLHLETFRIVRKTAPDSVIVGNIGAVQIAGMKDLSPVRRMIDLIEADGLSVHLNPLQEALQPEGEPNFRGVLKGIETLVKKTGVPVIVKETGCGISEAVARRLAGAGVSYIDVAGAGGTSWAGMESHRGAEPNLSSRFWDWGIPTALTLEMVSRVKGVKTIASGGIDGGITMAKALAMGARVCGAARPLLKPLVHRKEKGLARMIKEWRGEFRMAMFLTGSRNVEALKRRGVVIKTGRTDPHGI